MINKKPSQRQAHETVAFYIQCTYSVLMRVGGPLSRAQPQLMDKIMLELQEKLLANDIKR